MRRLRVTRAALVAFLLAVLTGRVSTQTPAAGATWQGWTQCQVAVQGAGYSNRQTHTWTISGAPTLVGSIAEYPVTWTVTGDGTYRGTNLDQTSVAQWTTNGSLPSARIGIFIRASDGRLLALFRSAQLNVPGGTAGTQQISATGSQPQTRSINQAIYEWRPLPVMEDAATSTHLTGSNSIPIANRLDALQPAGATGQAVCMWDFARSPSVPAPVPSGGQLATSSAAATGTILSAPAISLSTAGSAGTIQSAPDTTTATSTTTRERALAPNVATALTAIAASAPTIVNATVTPAGVIRGAFSGPTKLAAGVQGTFQLALTVPAPVESTVQYQPSNGLTGTTATTVQTISKTTTSFVIQGASLTFDSNEGETTTATLPSASSSPPPVSATFTFQTAGTYSVSVRGTVSSQSRAETVNTVTTTVTTLDVSCKCMKPVSSSTTVQPSITQISTSSYQISAPLQLTVSAE